MSVQADPDCVSVVLGRRFSRSPKGHGCARTPAAAARVLCAEGWGSYVALLRAPEGDWHVLRDPSGTVEAYTWRRNDLHVVASGMADIPACLLPPHLAIDWSAIADFLARPDSILTRTALEGIAVVCPGDVQPVGSRGADATVIWRPRDHLPRAGAGDREWASVMAETLYDVVARLAEPYQRLMVEVSGGFDSSLVAAAINRTGAGPKVVSALHYVGDRRESDERVWAADACRSAGLPMETVPRSRAPYDPDFEFADVSRDARPIYAALDGLRDRDTAERLRCSGAEALFTGKGGDAIFFSMPSPRVIADLWRDRGLRAIRDPLNAETARWLRRSVWSLWREAFAKHHAFRNLSLGPFAGPNYRADTSRPSHPWLSQLDAAPPGKAVQINALVSIQAAIGFGRRGQVADIIQPLLAQPMVELCLSIPTWRLIGPGRDRGLARAAYAAWLPQSVAQRRSKSRLTSAYARRLAGGLPAIRDHLLGGVLVDAGLLDGAAIDVALRDEDLMERGDGLALFQAASVESWVRHWQTRIPDAAHAPRRQAA